MVNAPGPYLRRNAARLLALAGVVALFGMAQLPTVPETERQALADRFRFTATALPSVEGPAPRAVRPVHPALAHISAWISSVGAAIAFGDIDGDGLPDDICHVDTITDQVIVLPVPGTEARYRAFALDAGAGFNRATMAPMGCIPSDMNEDGRLDLLVYYWGRPPIAFMAAGSGDLAASTFRPVDVAPPGERWYTNAATFADVDGDGHADLIVGNYFADGARILDADATETLGEHMHHSMSRAYNAGRNRLLLWAEAESGDEPRVRFADAGDVLDEKIAHAWTLAVAAADLDGDLLPEIYFANDFGPDRLLHNRSEAGNPAFAVLEGRKTLTKPNSKVLGRDSFKGMGAEFVDINGDGLLDIYVSNIAATYSLEESHFLYVNTGDIAGMAEGRAPFVDESEVFGLSRSGWGWDSKLADLDNDGVVEALQATGFVKGSVNRWPELQELAMENDELLSRPETWPRFQPGDDLSGNQHNPFFVRADSGRYTDIAPNLGLEPADDAFVTRGIAIADVDGDGDLDYAVANQWASSVFYRNDAPAAGGFLGLRLGLPVGESDGVSRVPDGLVADGRPAIGAVATVTLPDGRQLVAQVDGGNGHSGVRSSEIHFGLGAVPADARLAVQVDWRDGGGMARREAFTLAPGWHTVLLGSNTRVAEN